MKTVYLISCAKSQQKGGPCEAQLLHDKSALFRKSLAYARTLVMSDDDIFILSTKYRLVPLKKIILPHNTPPMAKKGERVAWANEVIRQIKERGLDPQNTKFVIFLGAKLCEVLTPHLPHRDLPLDGLSIGERLRRLDELLLNRQKEMCSNGQGQK